MSKPEKKGLVPALRFPEFRDAPEWQENELKQFLTESRVLGSKGNTAKKITVKLWGKGVFEKNDEIKGSVNTQYYRRTAGQFIYSKLDFLNQAFGIIPECLDGYESTVDLPCFDMRQGINSIFLLEYVKRKVFYEKLGETADGSRKARRIHADTFLSFPIFMPCIEEQQKIADCLASIDELVTFQTQKLHGLKAYKKGLMQQLFPAEGETLPKLRFPEFRDKGEWEEYKLGELADVRDGTHDSPKFFSEGRPLVTSKNLIEDGTLDLDNVSLICEVDYEQINRRSKVNIGDILFGMIGTIGNPVLVRSDGFAIKNVALFKQKDKLLNSYLVQLLRSQQIATKLSVINSGNSQKFVALGQLRGLSIPTPSIPEQHKIADCLASVDELITVQAQKIEALKAHKKGLMQQLFPDAKKE